MGTFQTATMTIDLPRGWYATASDILKTKGVVLIVGGPDSGKSTFCRYILARANKQGNPLAFVDADLGQSHIGPPTTIGLKLYPSSGPDEFGDQVDALHFIGQTSPAGSMLEIVVGLQNLVKYVRPRRQLIIVNTSGFIHGPAALRLKMAKVEALAPQHCVILARDEEANPIFRALAMRWPQVTVLAISPQARSKSWEERRHYREQRFANFFAKARPQQLSFTFIGWLGFPFGQGPALSTAHKTQLEELAGTTIWRAERTGGSVYLVGAESLDEARQEHLATHVAPDRLRWVPWSHLQMRLVGLLDYDLQTRSLGILVDVDWPKEQVTILTPMSPNYLREIRFLRLGQVRLEPSGRELPPLW